MKHIAGLAAATVCLSLTACSETTVMNKMGLGKAAPDESQVVTNNTLALPPDLQLRPPSQTQASETQAQQSTAAAAVPATPPDALAPAVENTAVASAETTPYDTGEQQLETYGSTSAAVDPAHPAPTVQSTQKRDLSGNALRDDAYAKYGISKTRPDGKPKTQGELDKELLEAIRQEKRRTNPRYGTFMNVGELFKGD